MVTRVELNALARDIEEKDIYSTIYALKKLNDDPFETFDKLDPYPSIKTDELWIEIKALSKKRKFHQALSIALVIRQRLRE